jgi:large subunit ribosomal protein L6
MSRIGKQPVAILPGVKVSVKDQVVTVEGPKGKLEFAFQPNISVSLDDSGKSVLVTRTAETREVRSLHGLTRALVNNMVKGVKNGYEKKLEVIGVGYVASIKANKLHLRVGFANEVVKPIPAGLTVTCPDQTHIVVQGVDCQLVGQFAAEVRSVKKPEPYKGKGIRYEGEYIKIKPGKSAT